MIMMIIILIMAIMIMMNDSGAPFFAKGKHCGTVAYVRTYVLMLYVIDCQYG